MCIRDSLYDPSDGPQIQQSGTFNANPVAMVAGLTTLRLLTEPAYEQMGDMAQRAANGLEVAFATAGIPARVLVAGSMFRIYFLEELPHNFRQASRDDAQMHRWLFFALLNRGIYTRVGGNASLMTQEQHVDELVGTVRACLQTL